MNIQNFIAAKIKPYDLQTSFIEIIDLKNSLSASCPIGNVENIYMEIVEAIKQRVIIKNWKNHLS